MPNTNQYIGKHLLVGLTYVDPSGSVTEQVQLHGDVTRITDEGIFLQLSDGEIFSLPPDVESLKTATPGSYTLRSTGEVVENPDFVCSWTINAPSPPAGT